jgi:multidrug efflux pump subunit AcrA (membrane-fusion protein)
MSDREGAKASVRPAEPSPDLFRDEAMRHRGNSRRGVGGVIRFAPAWTERVYWLLSATVLAALIGSAIATLHEYASGPAVIRIEGHVELRAPAAGVVDAIDVRLGQRVRKGALLLRLHAVAEAAELSRTRQEFEAQLVRMLRNPGDVAARQALAQLRGQLESAEARVADRLVVASQDGVLSDLRVRVGQSVAPGDLMATLIGDDSRLTVVALLPGSARPQLRAGMPLRLELTGYRYAFQAATIESISNAVVGPAEARRYLGSEVGDAVHLDGPLTVVVARLPERQFTVDARALDYYEGMSATASARLRRRPLISLLAPWLRPLVSHAE